MQQQQKSSPDTQNHNFVGSGKLPPHLFCSCRQLAAQEVLIQPACYAHSTALLPVRISKAMPYPPDAPTVEPLNLHRCHRMLSACYMTPLSTVYAITVAGIGNSPQQPLYLGSVEGTAGFFLYFRI